MQIKYINKTSQSGSFLLLGAAFLLPVSLVFATYTLDIYQLNEQRNRAQFAVDQAALVASKKLPYINLAREGAQAVLQRNGLTAGSRVKITSDDVEVEYSGRHKSLLGLFSSSGHTAYRVYSSAHINSKDVMIFMDASSYLAPEISNQSGTAWNTTQNWPRAQYFHQKVNRKYKRQDVPARILTQQCFNLAFSSLKEATIRLYDYYSSYGRNSVGVMVGPGNIDDVSMLKPLGSAYKAGTSPGEGRFDYFRSRYATDELCLAASQFEMRHKGYNFPPRSPALPATLFRGALAPLVNKNHVLPAANLQHLAIRDILWTVAARREYGTGPAPSQTPKNVDFIKVLNRTTNALLDAPYRPERRAVSNKQSATAILMMGDLPWIGGQRMRAYPPGVTLEQIYSQGAESRQLHVNNNAAIQKLGEALSQINQRAAQAQRQIQIYFNFTRHQGNYPAELYPLCASAGDHVWRRFICREFITDGEVLEKILDRFEKQGKYNSKNLIIRVFRSPSVEGLANNLPAWLPLADRTIFKDG